MRARLLFTAALCTGLPVLTAGPAFAAPPEYPHGAGVCLSQVATDPSVVGAPSLGAVISAVATASPGSMPGLIDSARGDGPSGCGQPPGPHSSGR